MAAGIHLSRSITAQWSQGWVGLGMADDDKEMNAARTSASGADLVTRAPSVLRVVAE